MRILISGGSGSGKSEFAENLTMQLEGDTGTRIYLATMKCFGEEDEKRIVRHRLMRREKGFLTIEKANKMKNVTIPEKSTVLLECLSNLLANEMFGGTQVKEENEFCLSERILADLAWLNQKCNHLVIVTNEIFSDGIEYSTETMQYMRQLGYLNQQLGKQSDVVYEVVCGIPICQKGQAK